MVYLTCSFEKMSTGWKTTTTKLEIVDFYVLYICVCVCVLKIYERKITYWIKLESINISYIKYRYFWIRNVVLHSSWFILMIFLYIPRKSFFYKNIMSTVVKIIRDSCLEYSGETTHERNASIFAGYTFQSMEKGLMQ